MNVGIFASAYGYTVDTVKPWMESLKASKFSGKVFVIVYNPTDTTLMDYFKENGIFVFSGNFTGETNMATQRFIDYAGILRGEYAKDIDLVITTDIRDVVFQNDPGVWLQNNIQDFDLIASGEGVMFNHEDWNGDTLEKQFGRDMFLELADKETLCSGVIAGKKSMIIKLFETIYELAFFAEDPAAFVDQIFYNVAIYKVFSEKTRIASSNLDWAANLGTIKALPENNDKWSLGTESAYNKFKRERTNKTYSEVLMHKIPEMKGDLIYSESGRPYAIVHQYDRYEPWKKILLNKYAKINYVS
jgi:hypothetical protein